MKRQELEELFPVGCVVSADIKEKLGFGKWEGTNTCFCENVTNDKYLEMIRNKTAYSLWTRVYKRIG